MQIACWKKVSEYLPGRNQFAALRFSNYSIVNLIRHTTHLKNKAPMRKSGFFLSIICLATLNVPAVAQDGFILQSTNQNTIRFTFNAEAPALDTIAVAGQNYLRPVFRDQVGVRHAQGAELPRMAAMLAVPPSDASYELEVIGAEWAPLLSALPLNPPLTFPQDSVLAAAANAGEADWPALARLDHTGWFRNLKVARVEIVPIRNINGQWQYLKNATLQLRWRDLSNGNSIAAAAPLSQAMISQTDLELYRGTILNFDDVRTYVKRDVVQAKRSSFRAGEQYLLFEVGENGVYRIDGATLRTQGINIDVVNPAEFRMYNNGGKILPSALSVERPDTLIEIPIIVQDGGDNRFDDNDAIYFFGVSVNDWYFEERDSSWQHYTNPFETKNTYWLSWFDKASAARRLTASAMGGVATTPYTSAMKLASVENEINNPFDSGRDWYGREYSTGDTARFSFDFSAPPANATGTVRYRVVSKTDGFHNVRFYWNGQLLDAVSFSGAVHYEGYLILRDRVRNVVLSSGTIRQNNTVQIAYSSTETFGRLYVDWIEVAVEDGLSPNAENATVDFIAPPDSGLTRFQLSNLDGDVRIFDISDPVAPRYFAFERDGGNLVFSDSLIAGKPTRYFASCTTLVPENFRLYTTSDLRTPTKGADLVIISPAEFFEEANRLAEHKRSFRNFEVEVIDVETVLNEFSWGLLDPVAIRDFNAYAFQYWRKQPRFVLLLGDATYDYRNLGKGSNRNLVPNYQGEESRLEELFNRNIEAFFTYVNGNDRDMDLAIGRLPAQTLAQAKIMVDKIIDYEANPEYGIWRTTLTMVGDDELVTGGRDNNETIHVQDAERIVENYVPEYMNVEKIYLMQYRAVREASISGVRKPGAQIDLLQHINNGSLIVNFVGHGNPTQWAHEVVFEQGRDFPLIQNGRKLPYLVAATCDFGRFDRLNSQSFPEEMMMADGRGIIGIVTASRVVFASSNARFNEQYYRQLFRTNGVPLTIGEAFANARLFTSDITNDEKYSILGDPSMLLGIPRVPASISAITPDSLFALNQTRVQGQLVGDSVSTGTGQVELLVFDDRKNTFYITSNGLTVSYFLPGNLLFRGKGTLSDGQFDMRFIVPKDVTYGGTDAKVSLYAFGEGMEAIGVRDRIPISLRSSVLFDDSGPAIAINFEDRETFANGDPVPQQASMVATIIDSVSGINVTAEIGHKITFTVDGETQNQLDLTSNFVYFPNDFRGGQLVAQLPELPLGRHFGELKAWDNSNNSATAFVEFVVTERDALSLTEVWNYPNPFSSNTSFTFVLSTEAEVKISVYTVAGRLIKTIDGIFANPGYNQIAWDGLDEDGDELANGVYLYRVVAKTQTSDGTKSTDFIGKIAVRR